METRDEDAGKLSDEELINLVILLIFAGIDTTRNQLSLAVQAFAEQPDQWEKLASDPERYSAAATEEALRVNPIGRWISREAAETFRYKERTIEKGTTLHLFTKTSGTDPAAFDDPDRIDLDAERPRTSRSAADCTTAWGTSSPARTSEWPSRRWPRG